MGLWLKRLHDKFQVQKHTLKARQGRRRTRLSLERLEDRLALATLTVTSLGDTVSGTTGTLDLREAILLVNSSGTAADSSGNSL